MTESRVLFLLFAYLNCQKCTLQKIIIGLFLLSHAYLLFLLLKMNNSLQIVDDLAKIFPDIEGQLCSRHSILLGKLKNTFNKVYDNMDPTNYIMVKGILDIYKDKDVALSMGLENGVIVMTHTIDQGASIYINSNHFDSQLIFSCDGKIEEGLNQYLDEITIAIKAATEGIESSKLKGVILYLHSNIVQSSFSYKQVLLISLYIAISHINNTLQNITVSQLISKMAKYKIFGDQSFLQKLFEFQNRKFTLKVGGQQFKIPLQKQNKLILCQLDLAKGDVKFELSKKLELQQRKNQVLRLLQQKHSFSSFLEMYEAVDQNSTGTIFQNEIQNQDSGMNANHLIEFTLKELNLLSQFNSSNITFEQLISAQWLLNSQYWKLHSQQVVQLVQSIKQTLKINSCMIINQTFALIIADKSKYTELLVLLRQKLHKGELKSKSLFKIQEQLVQTRWSSDKQIGQKMFTSVPSCGVSIYDPSQAIWFD